LKYGSGVPFCRLEDLEENLGILLPASTQWEVVEEAAESIKPVRDLTGGAGRGVAQRSHEQEGVAVRT
jgi:hypothetical protein